MHDVRPRLEPPSSLADADVGADRAKEADSVDFFRLAGGLEAERPARSGKAGFR